MTARLFHFTCDHGRAAIGARGVLRPYRHAQLGVDLLWLTSTSWPDRQATGLTSRYTSCDRMAHRYLVARQAPCEPWLGSDVRAAADPALVAALEGLGAPEQWWISAAPVPGRLG